MGEPQPPYLVSSFLSYVEKFAEFDGMIILQIRAKWGRYLLKLLLRYGGLELTNVVNATLEFLFISDNGENYTILTVLCLRFCMSDCQQDNFFSIKLWTDFDEILSRQQSTLRHKDELITIVVSLATGEALGRV